MINITHIDSPLGTLIAAADQTHLHVLQFPESRYAQRETAGPPKLVRDCR